MPKSRHRVHQRRREELVVLEPPQDHEIEDDRAGKDPARVRPRRPPVRIRRHRRRDDDARHRHRRGHRHGRRHRRLRRQWRRRRSRHGEGRLPARERMRSPAHRPRPEAHLRPRPAPARDRRQRHCPQPPRPASAAAAAVILRWFSVNRPSRRRDRLPEEEVARSQRRQQQQEPRVPVCVEEVARPDKEELPGPPAPPRAQQPEDAHNRRKEEGKPDGGKQHVGRGSVPLTHPSSRARRLAPTASFGRASGHAHAPISPSHHRCPAPVRGVAAAHARVFHALR